MLRIGLTGGIGSGKTTVSDQFRQLYKIPVIDADEISRELLSISGKAYDEVVSLFGSECLLNSGEIDRKLLREKIFTDNKLRASLENIVHPKVRAEILLQASTLSTQYCLIVIPLLIESNMQSIVDRILVINTNKQNQLDRVSSRDKCSKNHVEAIVDSQITLEERIKHADDVITNNGDLKSLILQIHQLHQKYLDLTI
ncbi:MAG: dephospho-CoA kinase [Gammaproteobacteria bacterium]|nr:dephospho-CoA kinase [Gammaproteobacteria bacterium]